MIASLRTADGPVYGPRNQQGESMAIITDKKAAAIKPDSKDISHGGVVGLVLSPHKTPGSGRWRMRYVSPETGKRRRLELGNYPAVSVAEAGRLAQEARELIARGIDPIEAQREVGLQQVKIPTVSIASGQVYATLEPGWRNAKHAAQWLSTMKAYVIPTIGNMKLDDVQPRHIAALLITVWTEKPETARRVKQRVKVIFDWARAHGYVTVNPVDVVDHLLPRQPVRRTHFPAMDWRVIPEWAAENLAKYPRGECTRPLLLFVILTACRSGEARGMRWCEVDLKQGVWTVPGERMKSGASHRAPLSRQVLAILEKQHGLHPDLVFPTVNNKVPSDMVLTAFLRRQEAPSTDPVRVATAHGFRSAFRDWCSENGIRRDVAERTLAHAVASKTEAAYHRTDLLTERKTVMQDWADLVLPFFVIR